MNVRLEYNGTKLAPTVERIPMVDARLAKSWGTHLNRLVLHARSAALKDTWLLRLTEDSSTGSRRGSSPAAVKNE